MDGAVEWLVERLAADSSGGDNVGAAADVADGDSNTGAGRVANLEECGVGADGGGQDSRAPGQQQTVTAVGEEKEDHHHQQQQPQHVDCEGTHGKAATAATIGCAGAAAAVMAGVAGETASPGGTTAAPGVTSVQTKGKAKATAAVCAAKSRVGGKAVVPQPEVRASRNKPCPCGSGRKFKACCMASGAQRKPCTDSDAATRALPAQLVTLHIYGFASAALPCSLGCCVRARWPLSSSRVSHCLAAFQAQPPPLQ